MTYPSMGMLDEFAIGNVKLNYIVPHNIIVDLRGAYTVATTNPIEFRDRTEILCAVVAASVTVIRRFPMTCAASLLISILARWTCLASA